MISPKSEEGNTLYGKCYDINDVNLAADLLVFSKEKKKELISTHRCAQFLLLPQKFCYQKWKFTFSDPSPASFFFGVEIFCFIGE